MRYTDATTEAGALRPLAHPWGIWGRDGSFVCLDSKAEWLSEWRHRVRVMEAADRPIRARREGLERALEANRETLANLLRHGAADAVLELLGMFCAADSGLASRLP